MNSLVEFTISSNQNVSLALWENTLQKVENLRIIDCKLDQKFTQFNKWFPNLRGLDFNGDIKFGNNRCLEEHFPHLEHIAMKLVGESIAKAIELNPQVRSLHIPYTFDAGLLQKASEHFEHLERFRLDCFNKDLWKIYNRIHFRQVKVFKMKCYHIDSRVAFIPFTFDALEEFTYTTLNGNNDEVYNFIRANPSLRKLSLGGLIPNKCYLTEENQMMIVTSLPSLTEIDLLQYTLTDSQALSFIVSLNGLRKFNFMLDYRNSFTGLME